MISGRENSNHTKNMGRIRHYIVYTIKGTEYLMCLPPSPTDTGTNVGVGKVGLQFRPPGGTGPIRGYMTTTRDSKNRGGHIR